jgi:hypothetical protein
MSDLDEPIDEDELDDEGFYAADEKRRKATQASNVVQLDKRSRKSGKKDDKPNANSDAQSGFRMTPTKGLLWSDDPDKPDTVVSGYFEIVAECRDDKGNRWGRLLRWPDADGRIHEYGPCRHCYWLVTAWRSAKHYSTAVSISAQEARRGIF